ncbi:hypothetical protein H4R18_003800 [Coemansia javaensis]|uniref:Uncharacterized protein n=1 Tax=Coemansia javaensis TaxID=2761396 RepID=A0A9W8H6Q9_9FUNG|nr:hypothetical protein H4R18_003800 [Coemansia javaensis]
MSGNVAPAFAAEQHELHSKRRRASPGGSPLLEFGAGWGTAAKRRALDRGDMQPTTQPALHRPPATRKRKERGDHPLRWGAAREEARLRPPKRARVDATTKTKDDSDEGESGDDAIPRLTVIDLPLSLRAGAYLRAGQPWDRQGGEDRQKDESPSQGGALVLYRPGSHPWGDPATMDVE